MGRYTIAGMTLPPEVLPHWVAFEALLIGTPQGIDIVSQATGYRRRSIKALIQEMQDAVEALGRQAWFRQQLQKARAARKARQAAVTP